jgi:hypothetical protein
MRRYIRSLCAVDAVRLGPRWNGRGRFGRLTGRMNASSRIVNRTLMSVHELVKRSVGQNTMPNRPRPAPRPRTRGARIADWLSRLWEAASQSCHTPGHADLRAGKAQAHETAALAPMPVLVGPEHQAGESYGISSLRTALCLPSFAHSGSSHDGLRRRYGLPGGVPFSSCAYRLTRRRPL